jgi:hypothetical protein
MRDPLRARPARVGVVALRAKGGATGGQVGRSGIVQAPSQSCSNCISFGISMALVTGLI